LQDTVSPHRIEERLEEVYPMKTFSALTLAFVLAGAGTAAAQDVRYNFDKTANFPSFKTYKWVIMVDRQIKESVDAELAKKGLMKIDSDMADLYVGYQAAVSTEKQFTSFDSGWGYGPGWYGGGWYGGGGGTTTGSTSTIYIGQLGLDIYAASAKSLIWRGMASKTIDQTAKPEKQQKNLNKAVAKMLKNYPPMVKK
jgi:hypothetical protein